MITTVYLIRHGEAEGNLYRRIHGQYDSLITPDGHRQIAALAARFQNVHVDACWSSDLTRARTTARAIYVPRGLELHTDVRFREIGMGIWEDMPFGEVNRDWSAQLQTYNRDLISWELPGSEPFAAFTDRFLKGLQDVAAQNAGRTVCIVAHGGIIRNALHELFFQGQPWNAVGQSDNTGVSRLEYEDGSWHLCYHNDNSHLPPELSTAARLAKADGRDRDMWFRPVDASEMLRYIRFRQDAWEHVYNTTQGFDGPAFWRDALRTTGGTPDAMVFAVLGTEVVGILQMNPLQGAVDGIGYIPFIYLREPYRGRGLGVQLIGQAVSFYRKRGRTRLQLSVAPCNAHAIHFYQKYGFILSGKTKGSFSTLHLMDLDIDLTRWQEGARADARTRFLRRFRS